MEMKRREVIKLIGGAAASWPLAVRAQQNDEIRRVGVVVNVAPDDPEAQTSIAAFKQAMQQLGWSEGRNLQIDFRGAAGDPERMQAFAKELVALQPHVILTRSTPVTAAVLKQTRVIPIVFTVVFRRPLRRRSGTSGRQCDRIHERRVLSDRQMAGTAQRGRAPRQTRRIHIQSEIGPRRRLVLHASD